MFYRIMTDEGKRKRYAYAIGLTDWPKQLISCPKCKREWEKSLMHEFGVSVPVVLSNDYYPDFAWYYIYHVSEKTKTVMVTAEITGFKLEDTQVLSVNTLTGMQIKELRHDGFDIKKIPVDPPKYYKLHVGIGAEFHEKSNIILQESCDQCGYEKYITKGKEWVDSEQGVVLKRDSLNGNDLFMAKGYGVSVFCTERFIEVYKKYGLTGLLFKEIEVL